MARHDQVANLRQEVKDLEAAIVSRDPPLPYTIGIARAKIATLQRQIKELEEVLAHRPRLPVSVQVVK